MLTGWAPERGSAMGKDLVSETAPGSGWATVGGSGRQTDQHWGWQRVQRSPRETPRGWGRSTCRGSDSKKLAGSGRWMGRGSWMAWGLCRVMARRWHREMRRRAWDWTIAPRWGRRTARSCWTQLPLRLRRATAPLCSPPTTPGRPLLPAQTALQEKEEQRSAQGRAAKRFGTTGAGRAGIGG